MIALTRRKSNRARSEVRNGRQVYTTGNGTEIELKSEMWDGRKNGQLMGHVNRVTGVLRLAAVREIVGTETSSGVCLEI